MATKVLTDISSTAWEHPADRAALNALRAIPGFDTVIRRVAGFIGDRALRQLFLGSAVRVGPTQRPRLDAMLTEVLATFDWPERPELYVTQSPVLNAAAVGFEKPFIVLNSSVLEHLTADEQRAIIAHEVGHIMSGHVVYRTIALIILYFGITALPFLAAAVMLPFQLALLEWYRKAEFSADRASLLGVQDRNTVMMLQLKLAGGAEHGHPIDLDAFMAQAMEYETKGDAWDRVLQILNTVMRDHPFATVRAGELQRWIDAGGYDKVIAGEYARRADTKDAPADLARDFSDASDYYGAQARAAVDKLGEVIGRARDAFDDAFRSSGPGVR
ncbi:MAG TPA: M48 family metallopeptidase [Gemmatimonadaceae bacterium]|nr:M48 family metallopeptidase [Gemmatimonadaceae bacterium]